MASASTTAPEKGVPDSTWPTRATTTKTHDEYEVRVHTASRSGSEQSEQYSSPFVSTIETSASDQENMSPAKAARHSRVLSGTELSPLKILTGQRGSSPEVAGTRSPRKVSPEKRFPVKISSSSGSSVSAAVPDLAPRTTLEQHTMTLEESVRENEGLKHAIDIFEDELEGRDDGEAGGGATITVDAPVDDDAPSGPDDTMVSTLSTFSAVPNLTMLAKLGQSPTRLAGLARDGSPLRSAQLPPPSDSGNTTNLLMDFTDQMRNAHKSPAKRARPSVAAAAATPSRQPGSLIDFDIPPMPTPRSVPTITPREFESLKSGFLSEVSSLKASLRGKEAEVQSLKTAVGDAEKRVGQSLEQLREARAVKEQLTEERDRWESRGREMESLLRKVREEIVLGQEEREELERKLEESERRREAAEMLHQEAESKMTGMRAGKDGGGGGGGKTSSPTRTKGGAGGDVEAAVERVARELHVLYKSKHETKVAALKKSYEGRWEKKVRELEARAAELADDNDRLRAGRDAAAARAAGEPDAVPGPEAEALRAGAVRDSAAIKELRADVQRLEAVEQTVRRDNAELRRMLERERVEKGELVQLAEEMMSMQSFVGGGGPQQRRQPPAAPPCGGAPASSQPDGGGAAAAAAAGPRGGIAGRGPSGLRAPASGLRAPHERSRSGGGGLLPRPGGARSGIMSSIERMGNFRGGRAAD